jgi:hypothetical protein
MPAASFNAGQGQHRLQVRRKEDRDIEDTVLHRAFDVLSIEKKDGQIGLVVGEDLRDTARAHLRDR